MARPYGWQTSWSTSGNHSAVSLVQNCRFANKGFLLIHIYTGMQSCPFKKDLRLPRKLEEKQPGRELPLCQCLSICLRLTFIMVPLPLTEVLFLEGSWLSGTLVASMLISAWDRKWAPASLPMWHYYMEPSRCQYVCACSLGLAEHSVNKFCLYLNHLQFRGVFCNGAWLPSAV